MKLRWGLYLAILAAPSIGAATIDVSAETSAMVRTGDTLVFHLLTWNFGVNAAAFGLPAYPSDVNFALVSAPLGGAGEFAATLESADRGSVGSVRRPDFRPGLFPGEWVYGRCFDAPGPPAPVAAAIRKYYSVLLVRRHRFTQRRAGCHGGPGTLYLLRQNLYASLTGGPLSVGAVPGSVDLESRVNRCP